MILNEENQNKEVLKRLQDAIGAEKVLTAREDRYLYSVDATAVSTDVYLADYVVFPSSTEDVQKIVKIADEFEIPITTRGAGTNMAGCCTPIEGGIVLMTTHLNKILKVDAQNKTCTVEAGVVVGDLQQEVNKFGLFYPPDPSNLKVSTIGGSVALASCGPRTFKYGGTKDYVLDLKVVLMSGEVINTGFQTIKNATGYNLTQLFTGSEGTLGIVTEATFRLISKPEKSKIMLAYFDDLNTAANAVNSVILANLTPSVLDIIDKVTMQTIENFRPSGFLAEKEAVLFIEVDGKAQNIDEEIQKIAEICEKAGSSKVVIPENEEQTENIWTARRASFAAVSQLAPNVLSEDMVVPRDKMPELIQKTKEIAKKYGLQVYIVGHAGDGNFHPHYPFDMRNEEETLRVKSAVSETFEVAISLGGTISGEHGVGLVKQPYLEKALSPVLYGYMKEIKKLFDPKNLLNKGRGI